MNILNFTANKGDIHCAHCIASSGCIHIIYIFLNIYNYLIHKKLNNNHYYYYNKYK